jgi:flagellar protein FlgJ
MSLSAPPTIRPSDFGALTELRHSVRSGTPEATEEVARQFEALMIQMMLKTMRDAMPEDSLLGGDQMRMYQDMFDQQISSELSRGAGIGLRDALMRQLDPEYSAQAGATAGISALRGASELEAYRSASIPAQAVPVPSAPVPAQAVPVPSAPVPAQAVPVPSASGSPGIDPLVNGFAAKEVAASVSQFWRPESPTDFVRELWPHAREAARELGVAAEVLIAQAALETGWGKRMIHRPDGSNSFNLFGIKADRSWQGERAQVATLEYVGGVAERQRASFRAYSGLGESFTDYVEFLRSNPRYRQALEQAQDTEAFVRGLQDAGYATDPKYADKILRILDRGTLPGIVEVKNHSSESIT